MMIKHTTTTGPSLQLEYCVSRIQNFWLAGRISDHIAANELERSLKSTWGSGERNRRLVNDREASVTRLKTLTDDVVDLVVLALCGVLRIRRVRLGRR